MPIELSFLATTVARDTESHLIKRHARVTAQRLRTDGGHPVNYQLNQQRLQANFPRDASLDGRTAVRATLVAGSRGLVPWPSLAAKPGTCIKLLGLGRVQNGLYPTYE